MVFSMFTSLQGQAILTFDFAGLAGNETSANSNSNATGMQSSTITRGAGLTASANGDRYNAIDWAVTSIANAVTGNDYMQFTLTPSAGYKFSVSSIVIKLQRSGAGHTAIALRNSIDNYTANLDGVKSVTDNTNTQTFTFTFAQADTSIAVTYRLYGYAETTAGSGGPGDSAGDDIVVNGAATELTPSIAISDGDIDTSTVSNGQSNVVLQRFDLDVTIANATLSGLAVTTAGTYSSTDITNLKCWYQSSSAFSASTATLLSEKTATLGPGNHVFPSFTSQLINAADTGYIFVTTSIAADAADGTTIQIDETPFSDITFTSGTKTGPTMSYTGLISQ